MSIKSLTTFVKLSSESFLRVPPLILIDSIFRISFGLGNSIFKSGIFLQSTSSSGSNEYYRDNEGLLSLLNVTKNESQLNSSTSSNSDGSFSSQQNPYFSSAQEHWLTSIFYAIWQSINSRGENETTSNLFSNSLVESAFLRSAQLNNGTLPGYLYQVGIGDFEIHEIVGDLIKLAEILFCLVVFVVAIVMFMMRTENLLKLYSYLLSFLSLYLVYMLAPLPIGSWGFVGPLISNLSIRLILAAGFFLSRTYPGNPETILNPSISSLLDALIFCWFFICGVVHFKPLLYLGIVFLLQASLWLSLPKAYEFLVSSWAETKRIQNEYGLSHLIQVESARLRINTVFRIFWVSRALYDGLVRCCDEPFSHVFKHIMNRNTETFTGIIGLTVTVSSLCHWIGEGILWILYYGGNTEADANRFGSISTVLFFILSLQTGLTTMSPEKRLDRIFKNIVLLGTALFHALHQMVAPLLHAFRNFQALQIRAVILSLVFFFISLSSSWYLLLHNPLSTWSLAVLTLAIEFKIKIFISLLISVVVWLSQLVQYPEILLRLGMELRKVLPPPIVRVFDKLYDQISHEDLVFYLKTIANLAEFLAGIFLFLNAIWIFLFESASAIRAIGMSIHAYFNIWCEAKKGLKIYSQRRTASEKIMSLQDATREELDERKDDVCAICYEEMVEVAKKTNCNHFFHAVCLRKWLYVQNNCPLCHEIISEEPVNATEANANVQQNQQQQHQHQNEVNRNVDNNNIIENVALAAAQTHQQQVNSNSNSNLRRHSTNSLAAPTTSTSRQTSTNNLSIRSSSSANNVKSNNNLESNSNTISARAQVSSTSLDSEHTASSGFSSDENSEENENDLVFELEI